MQNSMPWRPPSTRRPPPRPARPSTMTPSSPSPTAPSPARPTSTSPGAAATTSRPPPTPTPSTTTPPPRTPSVQSSDPDGVDLEPAAGGLVPLAGRRLGRRRPHAPLVPLLFLHLSSSQVDAGGGFQVVRLPDGYLLHLSSSQTASIAVFSGASRFYRGVKVKQGPSSCYQLWLRLLMKIVPSTLI